MSWRQCPRRWWLLRSRYRNVSLQTYPTVYGVAVLQGKLVHAALEAFRKHRGGSGLHEQFDARRFIKRRLQELLDGEVGENPRLDRGRLQAAFSIDVCLARFFALAGSESVAGPSPTNAQTRDGVGVGPPVNAEELWVETDEPPLSGRIDQVRWGVIVDYKTGEAHPAEHEAQLVFYASLWWARYGRPPEGLELHYPTEVRQVVVPSLDMLAREIVRLRAEFAEAEEMLDRPPPVARPGLEICQYCPVRQLCDEFWVSPATVPLRRPDAKDAEEGATVFRDIRLTELPPDWIPGRPFTGTAHMEGIGPVEVVVDNRYLPTSGDELAAEVRLLQVLLRYRDSAWTVRTVASSEAFWKA